MFDSNNSANSMNSINPINSINSINSINLTTQAIITIENKSQVKEDEYNLKMYGRWGGTHAP